RPRERPHVRSRPPSVAGRLLARAELECRCEPRLARLLLDLARDADARSRLVDDLPAPAFILKHLLPREPDAEDSGEKRGCLRERVEAAVADLNGLTRTGWRDALMARRERWSAAGKRDEGIHEQRHDDDRRREPNPSPRRHVAASSRSGAFTALHAVASNN